MKIICLKEKLQNALNLVEKISGKSTTLPILNCLLLETQQGRIKISSTDLENAAIIWIPGKIERQGKIAVPAKILGNYVNNLFSKKIILISKDETNLEIISDESKALIQGYKTKDFPIIPLIEKKDFFEVASNEFIQGINQIINIPSISESRPEISGLYFNIETNSIKLAATDSFRLGEKNIPSKNKLTSSFIVPYQGVSGLIKLFETENKIKIYHTPNQVLFEGEDVCFISRLIEGEYPNYLEIVPKKFETEILIDKEEFSKHLRAISVFTGRNNDVKLTLNPKTARIDILSKESGIGEGKSVVSVKKIKGKKMEILFNWRFLQDGLHNISDPSIFIGLNSENTPALLKGENDKSYFYVLMPIKTR